MKHIIFFAFTNFLCGCVGNERECVLPSNKVNVKLTSIISEAEFQLKRIDKFQYEVKFTTYDPRDGQRLYTAFGTGTCRDQQFSAEFTNGKLEKPELKVVGGSFNGIFSKDSFGKHYGEWSVKVELLGQIEPMPFQVQEVYGKKYVNDKGVWSLR